LFVNYRLIDTAWVGAVICVGGRCLTPLVAYLDKKDRLLLNKYFLTGKRYMKNTTLRWKGIFRLQDLSPLTIVKMRRKG